MTARPIRPRIPYEIDREIVVGGREPEHPIWLHVLLLLTPVLAGAAYLWLMGNYWQ